MRLPVRMTFQMFWRQKRWQTELSLLLFSGGAVDAAAGGNGTVASPVCIVPFQRYV